MPRTLTVVLVMRVMRTLSDRRSNLMGVGGSVLCQMMR